MRRLVLLMLLTIPLVGAMVEETPGAAACTLPRCRVSDCIVVYEDPEVDPATLTVDPGLLGVECELPDPGPI